MALRCSRGADPAPGRKENTKATQSYGRRFPRCRVAGATGPGGRESRCGGYEFSTTGLLWLADPCRSVAYRGQMWGRPMAEDPPGPSLQGGRSAEGRYPCAPAQAWRITVLCVSPNSGLADAPCPTAWPCLPSPTGSRGRGVAVYPRSRDGSPAEGRRPGIAPGRPRSGVGPQVPGGVAADRDPGAGGHAGAGPPRGPVGSRRSQGARWEGEPGYWRFRGHGEDCPTRDRGVWTLFPRGRTLALTPTAS